MLNDELRTDILELVGLLVTFAVLFMTAIAIPWIRAKAGEQNMATAERIANNAVKYVQQTMADKDNATKFLAALDEVKAFAARKGIKLSDDDWGTIIEAAVHNLRLEWGESTVTPPPQLEEQPDNTLDASGSYPVPRTHLADEQEQLREDWYARTRGHGAPPSAGAAPVTTRAAEHAAWQATYQRPYRDTDWQFKRRTGGA